MIDGQSVSDVTQDSLRGQIGMVQQEGALLHRSIRDNILYGCADAGDPAMIQAARQAKAQEFILNLQDLEGRSGYDAHVGERGGEIVRRRASAHQSGAGGFEKCPNPAA